MIRILATLAIQGALPALAARFGEPVETEFGPTALLLDRIRAGAVADAAVLTRGGVDGLATEGLIDPASIVDVALSRVGLAVRPGAPKPDISTCEALRTALLSGSVAYSRAGASGIAFAALIERMGIADAVNARARVIPSGFTAELLARGEVDMAVQQVSELMVVPGIELVGPFPASVDTPGLFSAGRLRAGTGGADGFLRFLGSPEAGPILRAAGLEPQ